MGKALAERFWKRGANIALIARKKDKLETIRDSLNAEPTSNQKAEAFPCDISDFAQVKKSLKQIVIRFGNPTILINSAGVLHEGYFENQSLETFHEIMNTNYFGTLHGIKAVLPYFEKSGNGTIVNICSLGGLIGSFGYAAYCSSKFAVHGLTEVLRTELKPRNIEIHLVCPPEFEGPMVAGVEAAGRTPENREYVHTLPVQTAEQVADEVMRGIDKKRYKIITGSASRLIEKLNRWMPGLLLSYADKRLAKIYRGPHP